MFAAEIQLLHHKLYLKNPPPEIEQFKVSHGFNILTLNVARYGDPLIWRAGIGVTLPHGDSTVRGEKYLSNGYKIGDPALLAGVSHEWPIGDHVRLLAELQLIAAWAEVGVAGGHADVASFAFHLLLGAGYLF
jgi:hypothetical protein